MYASEESCRSNQAPSTHTAFQSLQQLLDIDREKKKQRDEAYQALLEECEAISAAVVNETVGRTLSARSIQRHARGRTARQKVAEKRRSQADIPTHQKPSMRSPRESPQRGKSPQRVKSPQRGKTPGRGKSPQRGKSESPHRNKSESPQRDKSPQRGKSHQAKSSRDNVNGMSKEDTAATSLQKMHRGNTGRKDFSLRLLSAWLPNLYTRACRISEGRKKTAMADAPPLMTPEKVRPPNVTRSKKNEMSEDAAFGITKVQNALEQTNSHKFRACEHLEDCVQLIQTAYRDRLERRETEKLSEREQTAIEDGTKQAKAENQKRSKSRKQKKQHGLNKRIDVNDSDCSNVATSQTVPQQEYSTRKCEKISAVGEKELDTAATRIQAAQRRKLASKQMEKQRQLKSDIIAHEKTGTSQSQRKVPKMTEDYHQSGIDSLILEAAATRIQAAQRRKRASKEVEKQRHLKADAQAREAAATRIQATQRQRKQIKEVQRERPLRLRTQDVDAAATKIQAVQRRKQALKEVDLQRQLRLDARALEVAATKIQAAQRRKNALLEVERERQLRLERQLKLDAEQAREAAATRIQAAQRRKRASKEVETYRQLKDMQARDSAATKIQAAQRRTRACKEVEKHRQLQVDTQARASAATRIQAAQRRKRACKEVDEKRDRKADLQAREAAAIKIQKLGRGNAVRKRFGGKVRWRGTSQDDFEPSCCEVEGRDDLPPSTSFGEPSPVRDVSVQCDFESGEGGAQFALCSRWYQISALPLCRLVRNRQVQTSWTTIPISGMEEEIYASDEPLEGWQCTRACSTDIESDDLVKTLKLPPPDACKTWQATGDDIDQPLAMPRQNSFVGPWYPVPPPSPKIKTRPISLNAFAAAPTVYGSRPLGSSLFATVGVISSSPRPRTTSPKSPVVNGQCKSPEGVQCAPTSAKKIATALQIRRECDPLWRRSSRPRGGPKMPHLAVAQLCANDEIRPEDGIADPKGKPVLDEIDGDSDEKQILPICSDGERSAVCSMDWRPQKQKSPRAFSTLASGPGRPYAGHCMQQSPRLHVSQRPPWQEIGRGIIAGGGTLPNLPSRREGIAQ